MTEIYSPFKDIRAKIYKYCDNTRNMYRIIFNNLTLRE